jgi:hypothetical protein
LPLRLREKGVELGFRLEQSLEALPHIQSPETKVPEKQERVVWLRDLVRALTVEGGTSCALGLPYQQKGHILAIWTTQLLRELGPAGLTAGRDALLGRSSLAPIRNRCGTIHAPPAWMKTPVSCACFTTAK